MKLPTSLTTITTFSKLLALFLFILFPIAGFYVGMQYQQSIKPISQTELLIQPTHKPSESNGKPTPATNETNDWKTYASTELGISFRYPLGWIEKPFILRGSGSTQQFEDPTGTFSLTFLTNGNYNQVTGKPYENLDEVVNMPYQVKTVSIDGEEGRQPLPRAGSENVNSVIFFSKDKTLIYSLELTTDNPTHDTPENDIKEGQTIFSRILSTFTFTQ